MESVSEAQSSASALMEDQRAREADACQPRIVCDRPTRPAHLTNPGGRMKYILYTKLLDVNSKTKQPYLVYGRDEEMRRMRKRDRHKGAAGYATRDRVSEHGHAHRRTMHSRSRDSCDRVIRSKHHYHRRQRRDPGPSSSSQTTTPDSFASHSANEIEQIFMKPHRERSRGAQHKIYAQGHSSKSVDASDTEFRAEPSPPLYGATQTINMHPSLQHMVSLLRETSARTALGASEPADFDVGKYIHQKTSQFTVSYSTGRSVSYHQSDKIVRKKNAIPSDESVEIAYYSSLSLKSSLPITQRSSSFVLRLVEPALENRQLKCGEVKYSRSRSMYATAKETKCFGGDEQRVVETIKMPSTVPRILTKRSRSEESDASPRQQYSFEPASSTLFLKPVDSFSYLRLYPAKLPPCELLRPARSNAIQAFKSQLAKIKNSKSPERFLHRGEDFSASKTEYAPSPGPIQSFKQQLENSKDVLFHPRFPMQRKAQPTKVIPGYSHRELDEPPLTLEDAIKMMYSRNFEQASHEDSSSLYRFSSSRIDIYSSLRQPSNEINRTDMLVPKLSCSNLNFGKRILSSQDLQSITKNNPSDSQSRTGEETNSYGLRRLSVNRVSHRDALSCPPVPKEYGPHIIKNGVQFPDCIKLHYCKPRYVVLRLLEVYDATATKIEDTSQPYFFVIKVEPARNPAFVELYPNYIFPYWDFHVTEEPVYTLENDYANQTKCKSMIVDRHPSLESVHSEYQLNKSVFYREFSFQVLKTYNQLYAHFVTFLNENPEPLEVTNAIPNISFMSKGGVPPLYRFSNYQLNKRKYVPDTPVKLRSVKETGVKSPIPTPRSRRAAVPYKEDETKKSSAYKPAQFDLPNLTSYSSKTPKPYARKVVESPIRHQHQPCEKGARSISDEEEDGVIQPTCEPIGVQRSVINDQHSSQCGVPKQCYHGKKIKGPRLCDKVSPYQHHTKPFSHHTGSNESKCPRDSIPNKTSFDDILESFNRQLDGVETPPHTYSKIKRGPCSKREPQRNSLERLTTHIKKHLINGKEVLRNDSKYKCRKRQECYLENPSRSHHCMKDKHSSRHHKDDYKGLMNDEEIAEFMRQCKMAKTTPSTVIKQYMDLNPRGNVIQNVTGPRVPYDVRKKLNNLPDEFYFKLKRYLKARLANSPSQPRDESTPRHPHHSSNYKKYSHTTPSSSSVDGLGQGARKTHFHEENRKYDSIKLSALDKESIEYVSEYTEKPKRKEKALFGKQSYPHYPLLSAFQTLPTWAATDSIEKPNVIMYRNSSTQYCDTYSQLSTEESDPNIPVSEKGTPYPNKLQSHEVQDYFNCKHNPWEVRSVYCFEELTVVTPIEYANSNKLIDSSQDTKDRTEPSAPKQTKKDEDDKPSTSRIPETTDRQERKMLHRMKGKSIHPVLLLLFTICAYQLGDSSTRSVILHTAFSAVNMLNEPLRGHLEDVFNSLPVQYFVDILWSVILFVMVGFYR